MKICTKCKIEKNDNDFQKNQYWCKLCFKQQNSKYYKENKPAINLTCKIYRDNNKEKIAERHKKYNELNKEQIKEKKKIYYENNKETIHNVHKIYRDNNKEKIAEYFKKNKEPLKIKAKEYTQKNKQKINDYRTNKKKTNVDFKFKIIVSTTIWKVLKRRGGNKQRKSSSKYININKLITHLENLFEPWMNWKNHGKYDPKTWDDNDPTTWTWQLDHIKPDSHFHYTSMDDPDFKKCWALENLRPYSAKQNILDGNRR